MIHQVSPESGITILSEKRICISRCSHLVQTAMDYARITWRVLGTLTRFLLHTPTSITK
ncbi:hypothetical protein KC19_6G143600 [Ceratodon purpureus]|uniref:Uncharacterized protein n=1 Tax=Ceratodon purpureus TaxID=3225 RepID=A0A8T0HGN1_CERPU|nr:hypothetical protein KC19_6G143600 [Ceratodon purpureus]